MKIFQTISNYLNSIPERLYKSRIASPLSIQIIWFAMIILGTVQGFTALSMTYAREPEEPPIRTQITVQSELQLTDTTDIQPSPVASRIKEYDWREDVKEKWGEDSEIMIAVIMAESHGKEKEIGYNCRYGKKIYACRNKEDRKNAVSYDYGLAMISDQHGYSKEELFNPKVNIQIAYEIYQKQGFDAWFAYKNKKHLSFLN